MVLQTLSPKPPPGLRRRERETSVGVGKIKGLGFGDILEGSGRDFVTP